MSAALTPSNTGVEPATSIEALIDWLSFTLPDGYPLAEIKTKLAGAESWDVLPRGAFGYMRGYRRGAISIYYGGKLGMGIHVCIPGTGCRQLEQEGVLKPDFGLIRDLDGSGAGFTRIDVAVDDKAHILEMDKIREHVDQNWYASHVRRDRVTRSRSRNSQMRGESLQSEYCVTLGSAKSERQLRIYDKAAEQGVPGHWIRVELQLRGRAAGRLVETLLEQRAQAIAGAIRGFVEFKNPGTHSQRDRWETAAWWNEFLGHCAKLRMGVAPPVQCFERKAAWVSRCVAPTLAFLMHHPDGGFKRILGFIAEGSRRLRPRACEILVAAGVKVLPQPPTACDGPSRQAPPGNSPDDLSDPCRHRESLDPGRTGG